MERVTLTHTVDTPIGFHVSNDEQVNEFLEDAFDDAISETRDWLDEARIEYTVQRQEKESVIGGSVTELEIPVKVPDGKAERVEEVFSTTPVDVKQVRRH